MLLESLIPYLPTEPTEILVYVVGMLGTILLAYSVFVESEFRGDLIRLLGAAGVFVYTLYIGNVLLMITFIAIFLASAVEFIEIYLGVHKHSAKDVREYKEIR